MTFNKNPWNFSSSDTSLGPTPGRALQRPTKIIAVEPLVETVRRQIQCPGIVFFETNSVVDVSILPFYYGVRTACTQTRPQGSSQNTLFKAPSIGEHMLVPQCRKLDNSSYIVPNCTPWTPSMQNVSDQTIPGSTPRCHNSPAAVQKLMYLARSEKLAEDDHHNFGQSWRITQRLWPSHQSQYYSFFEYLTRCTGTRTRNQ